MIYPDSPIIPKPVTNISLEHTFINCPNHSESNFLELNQIKCREFSQEPQIIDIENPKMFLQIKTNQENPRDEESFVLREDFLILKAIDKSTQNEHALEPTLEGISSDFGRSYDSINHRFEKLKRYPKEIKDFIFEYFEKFAQIAFNRKITIDGPTIKLATFYVQGSRISEEEVEFLRNLECNFKLDKGNCEQPFCLKIESEKSKIEFNETKKLLFCKTEIKSEVEKELLRKRDNAGISIDSRDISIFDVKLENSQILEKIKQTHKVQSRLVSMNQVDSFDVCLNQFPINNYQEVISDFGKIYSPKNDPLVDEMPILYLREDTQIKVFTEDPTFYGEKNKRIKINSIKTVQSQDEIINIPESLFVKNRSSSKQRLYFSDEFPFTKKEHPENLKISQIDFELLRKHEPGQTDDCSCCQYSIACETGKRFIETELLMRQGFDQKEIADYHSRTLAQLLSSVSRQFGFTYKEILEVLEDGEKMKEEEIQKALFDFFKTKI